MYNSCYLGLKHSAPRARHDAHVMTALARDIHGTQKSPAISPHYIALHAARVACADTRLEGAQRQVHVAAATDGGTKRAGSETLPERTLPERSESNCRPLSLPADIGDRPSTPPHHSNLDPQTAAPWGHHVR